MIFTIKITRRCALKTGERANCLVTIDTCFMHYGGLAARVIRCIPVPDRELEDQEIDASQECEIKLFL